MKEITKAFLQKSSLLPLLILVLILLSCDKNINTEQELRAYINNPENGLGQEKEINGINISCTYHPLSLHAGKRKPTKDNDLANNRLYFVLSFSKNNKELLKQLDYSLYSEMVQVLSFRMQQYITMHIKGRDPIEPLDCLFQQTYGMGNANTLVLVFDKESIQNRKSFTIHLKEFGLGLGNHLFEYETKKLNDIDKIIL